MLHKRQNILFLCVIILSAVSFVWLTAHILSLYPWHGTIHQVDPDSMLFARLLEQSILRGKIVETDNYGCFPYEIKPGFGPFYLYFLYQTTSFFFTIFPDCGFDPMAVAGFLPVLTLWVTWLMVVGSLWYLSSKPGLVLFCAVFLFPGFSSKMTGTMMQLDYESLNSFFIWAWLLACALFMESRQFFLKILGGLIVGLFIASWNGTPLFFFLVTAYGFTLWFIDAEWSDRYLVFAYSSMLVGGFLNLIFIVNTITVSEGISLTKYSYFQPLCILIGGFFLFTLEKLRALPQKKALSLVLLCGTVLVLFFAFGNQIGQALGVLLQKDPVHATISELQSIISFSKLVTYSNIASKLVHYFGWPIILLPLFAFGRLTGLSCSSESLFKCWLLVVICMTIHQVRFMRWLGIGAGLFSGLSAYALWVMMRNQLRNERWQQLRMVAIFLPMLTIFLSQSFAESGFGITLDNNQIEAYNWIARNTPPTSGYGDDVRPEYSILSYWDQGNQLAYHTKRPTSVNNAMWGFKTMADIFSSSTEDEAFKLCQENGVRYIFLCTFRDGGDDVVNFWPSFKDMPRKPEYVLQYRDVPMVKDFKNWFYYWLMDNLALTPKGEFTASTRFRAVYAAKADSSTLAPFILFERVKGAKIHVQGDPGSEVSLSLELQISSQKFLYKVKALAGADGKAAFVLPYATSHHGGRVTTDSIYKIACQETGKMVKASAKVSEAEVQNGLEALAIEKIE